MINFLVEETKEMNFNLLPPEGNENTNNFGGNNQPQLNRKISLNL